MNAYATPTPTQWVTLGKVESVSITSGRDREEGRVNSSVLGISVRNDDRSLDPNNAASPYHPNIVPGAHIRVLSLWDGIEYPLFTGHVEDWPQVYESSFSARVDLDASDAFALFARHKLRESIWAIEIGKDNPKSWLRLGESSGNVAADSSGNDNDGQYQSTAAAQFNTMGVPGLITGDPDGAFAPAAANGQRVLMDNQDVIANYPFTFECWAGTFPNRAITKVLFSAFDGPFIATQKIGLSVDYEDEVGGRPGELQFYLYNNAFVLQAWSGRQFDDGAAHHVVVRVNSASSVEIIVDGVDTTVMGTSTAPVFPGNLITGYAIGNNPSNVFGDNGFEGYIDEWIVYDYALPDDRIFAHYLAGGRGWVNHTTGQRLEALLDAIGWSSTARDIDVGNTTLTSAVVSGSWLEHMQVIGDAEDGLFYMSFAGKVTLVERHAFLKAPYTTSQATFGDTDAELPYENLEPSSPAQYIRNEIKVTPEGAPPQYAIDTASQAHYGPRTYERSPLPISPALARDAAHYLLNRYKEPHTRFASMVLSPLGDEYRMFPQMLVRRLGDLITVVRRPPGGGDPITVACRIEGIDHDFDGRGWTTTWRLSPADTTTDYWILGVTALGVGCLAY